jgi:opacity protein-like surface antigen
VEKMKTNKYSITTAILLAVYMSPAASEYFIGVDYSAFNTSMKNNSIDTGFYESQQRIRVGYRGQWSGFEVDYLSGQDDTNASGSLTYSAGPALGAYWYLHEDWVYGKLGVLVTDSTLKNNASGVSNDHTLVQFSAAIGVQFELTKHVYFNTDYTYSSGDGEYRDVLGTDDPTITTHALAAGLTLGF